MATRSSAASFILRFYFAVVSAVTLFTLMFGAIDLLTIGLRQVVPGANQPEWGLEDCSILINRYPGTKVVTDTAVNTEEPSEEEQKAACEARNTDVLRNWQSQQAANTVRNIALIIISLPLFVLHFRVVYKDWKTERE